MRRIKNALLAMIFTVLMLLSMPVLAAERNIADSVGVDRFAHFGLSYVICDQLKRNAGFNDFWAATTTLAIGAAKEKWIDNQWDTGDFASDCAGVLFYQIRF